MSACMYEHHMHTWYSRRPEENIGYAKIGVTDCRLLCRSREPNPCPLEEQ